MTAKIVIASEAKQSPDAHPPADSRSGARYLRTRAASITKSLRHRADVDPAAAAGCDWDGAHDDIVDDAESAAARRARNTVD
jgi:hypothetical protein